MLAPPGENAPAAHTPVLLVPKHVQPPGQIEQVGRFDADPPCVYDPTAHFRQILAPTPLCRSSAPQALHMLLPAPLKVPAEQGTYTLPPEHAEPAGHCEHDWRVLSEPPDVYDPVGHLSQRAAAAPLNSVSPPHGEQLPEPSGLNVPETHCALLLVPSQDDPGEHSEHVFRVLPASSPPEVIYPAPQSLQLPPVSVSLYLLSDPHVAQDALPATLNVPGAHATALLSPVQ